MFLQTLTGCRSMLLVIRCGGRPVMFRDEVTRAAAALDAARAVALVHNTSMPAGGTLAHLKVRVPSKRWAGHTTYIYETGANRKVRVGTARQKMALERGTNPKHLRPTCTCEYGLHSRRAKSAGVAKQPRERDSRPEIPTVRRFATVASL
jgi:hypothetical protein